MNSQEETGKVERADPGKHCEDREVSPVDGVREGSADRMPKAVMWVSGWL